MASPRPLTIVELAQLTQFKDEIFPQTFIANATCVFDHDHNDIKTILNARDVGTLKLIRDALLIEIEKLFPNFPAMSALSRTETPDDIPVYIQDILLLGASFAKQSQAIHLASIYVPAQIYQDELDLSQLDLTDMAVLVPIVKRLMQNVESNNRKIAKISSENEQLKIENATLKMQHANKIAIINATLGIEDQITPDSPQTVEPANEPVNTEPVAEQIETPSAGPRPDTQSSKIVAAKNDKVNKPKENPNTRGKFQKKPFRKPNQKPYKQNKPAYKRKWTPPPSEWYFWGQFRDQVRDQYSSQFRDREQYFNQFRDRDSFQNQYRDYYRDQYRGQFIDEYQNRYPY